MRTKSTKLYPLVASQRLLAYAVSKCPLIQLLNVGTSVAVGGDIIEFEELKKALSIAYKRCDSMRIRFCKNENGEMLQYEEMDDEGEFEFLDLSHLNDAEAKRELEILTETPFELYDGRGNRIVMIHMPGGFKGFYINVNHLTMDSGSIIAFIVDVIQIYCHFKYDYAYPKDTASYFKMLEKDIAYENNSKKQQIDREFWDEFTSRPEPIFTDITGTKLLNDFRDKCGSPDYRAAGHRCEDLKARHALFNLEKEPTGRMLDFCLTHRIPMVCLLILGIRTFLSKMNNEEENISLTSTISRRAGMTKKKCGGTRIHCFPCTTNISADTSFMDALHIIQRSQFEIFRHADFDPVEVMKMKAKNYNLEHGGSYEGFALTYQPMTMRAGNIDMLSGIDYKTDWYSNGVSAHEMYLTVMHNSITEGMDFYYEYQPGRLTFHDLEYMYYYLCKIIFMGIENPTMSIGDIIHTV